MASTSDIDQVRVNTNELNEDNFTYAQLDAWVDAFGVTGASAKVWEAKAAKYADLVDVSEAGAQERLSQLHDHAIAQLGYWNGIYENETAVATGAGRVRVKVIKRSA